MAPLTAFEVRGGKKGGLCVYVWINLWVVLIRSLLQQEHSTESPASRKIRQCIGLTSKLSDFKAWVEEFDRWDRKRLLSYVWVRKNGGLVHCRTRRGKGSHKQGGTSLSEKLVRISRSRWSSQRYRGMRTDCLQLPCWVVRLGWAVLYERAAASSLPRWCSWRALWKKGEKGSLTSQVFPRSQSSN